MYELNPQSGMLHLQTLWWTAVDATVILGKGYTCANSNELMKVGCRKLTLVAVQGLLSVYSFQHFFHRFTNLPTMKLGRQKYFLNACVMKNNWTIKNKNQCSYLEQTRGLWKSFRAYDCCACTGHNTPRNSSQSMALEWLHLLLLFPEILEVTMEYSFIGKTSFAWGDDVKCSGVRFLSGWFPSL